MELNGLSVKATDAKSTWTAMAQKIVIFAENEATSRTSLQKAIAEQKKELETFDDDETGENSWIHSAYRLWGGAHLYQRNVKVASEVLIRKL